MARDFLKAGGIPVGGKLPTIQELAAKYAVSATTVGKAVALLEAEGWITKRRGSGMYVAALPGAGEPLRQRATRRIGCVIDSLSTPLAYRLFSGIERVVRKRDCVLEIVTTDQILKEEHRQVAKMVASGVQGIILCPTPYRNRADEYLATEFRDFPIVVTDLYQREMERPHVIFDNWSAGREMTAYLLAQGHRNIAFLKYGDVEHRSVEDRVLGYRRALEDAGIRFRPENVLPFDSRADGERTPEAALDKFLSLDERPNALIVLDDLHAPEAIRYLEARGVSVPDDVLVTGFDNIQEPVWNDRFPTTNPDFARMGEYAVELLLQMLNGEVAREREIILPCPLHLPKPARGWRRAEALLQA